MLQVQRHQRPGQAGDVAAALPQGALPAGQRDHQGGGHGGAAGPAGAGPGPQQDQVDRGDLLPEPVEPGGAAHGGEPAAGPLQPPVPGEPPEALCGQQQDPGRSTFWIRSICGLLIHLPTEKNSKCPETLVSAN